MCTEHLPKITYVGKTTHLCYRQCFLYGCTFCAVRLVTLVLLSSERWRIDKAPVPSLECKSMFSGVSLVVLQPVYQHCQPEMCNQFIETHIH